MYDRFEVNITPLNRNRRVTVFLPNDYEQNEAKRYPVLYMHDGQNLFIDEECGFGTSWGISDYLNSSDIDLIVVGIDCNTEGYKRLDEYGPWKSTTLNEVIPEITEKLGGEGQAYIDYIVHELKPMIDNKYRTIHSDTSMAGSSMGGLISTYAACMYPDVFKKIASVSSAYWFNQEEIEALIKESDLSSIKKFYLDIGTNESDENVSSSKAVFKLLNEKIKDCRFEIVEGAVHNEKAWRERVPLIFNYLYK